MQGLITKRFKQIVIPCICSQHVRGKFHNSFKKVNDEKKRVSVLTLLHVLDLKSNVEISSTNALYFYRLV